MKQSVTKAQARKWIGKKIVATKKDGTFVSGKLLRISGNRLILQKNSGKKVDIKAIIPLVLFDLLAIGTAPYFVGGGYGNVGNVGVPPGGYGNYNSYGNYGNYGNYGYGNVGGGYPPYGNFF